MYFLSRIVNACVKYLYKTQNHLFRPNTYCQDFSIFQKMMPAHHKIIFNFQILSLYSISSKVSKSCFLTMSSCVQGGTKLSISGEYNNTPRSCPTNIIIQFIAFISNSVIRFSCSHYFNDQSCNSESLNHPRFCVSGHLLCFILNLVSNFAVGCIHCGIRRSVGNQSN